MFVGAVVLNGLCDLDALDDQVPQPETDNDRFLPEAREADDVWSKCWFHGSSPDWRSIGIIWLVRRSSAALRRHEGRTTGCCARGQNGNRITAAVRMCGESD